MAPSIAVLEWDSNGGSLLMTHAIHTPDWFAAEVWTGREHLAAEHLLLRGFEVFLPCYRENRRWSDRVKTVNRPLFAGYLFVRNARHTGASVVTAPAVKRIVASAGHPLPVSADEIATLKRAVAAQVSLSPCEYFTAGTLVDIESGPLHGVQGLVVRSKGNDRLVVSVTMLQRSVAIEIDAAWVVRSHSRATGIEDPCSLGRRNAFAGDVR